MLFVQQMLCFRAQKSGVVANASLCSFLPTPHPPRYLLPWVLCFISLLLKESSLSSLDSVLLAFELYKNGLCSRQHFVSNHLIRF